MRERVAVGSLTEVALQGTVVFLHLFLGGLHFCLRGTPAGNRMESFFGISTRQDCLNPFMCCCCRKKKDLEVKFSGRHCTDPLCLVLFAAAWFVSIIVLIAAHRTADMAS